jgi:outer membrane protein
MADENRRQRHPDSKGAFMKRVQTFFPGIAVLALSACGLAQITVTAKNLDALPSAPMPQSSSQQTTTVAGQLPGQTPAVSTAQTSSTQTSTTGATPLTLKDGEALAIKNNPQISVARLLALASQQVAREVRSNLWPTATGDITGVDAMSGTRITAGVLNNPIIYERAAAGVVVTQLITDFGRTTNLVASANYSAKAENENALATRQQILLAVNRAFYNALQAQAVLKVAEETVKARQTVADQVGALFKSKLKSELDFSFASVNLAQAKLLLLDAQNSQDAAQATLSMVLGFPNAQTFTLSDDTQPVSPPPGNVDDLIAQAFSSRPEVRALQFQYQSATKFQKAERDLLFPSVRAIGAVGVTPIGNPAVAASPESFDNTYGAVGANMEIPIFNGFQYFARSKEAGLRAQATDERLRDLKNTISRDVRTSWLGANAAFQKLSVTQQLLDQAKLALDLAQSRYKLGLGSIVEVSQAQLQETQAEIAFAQAGYDYRLSLAVLRYETTGI